MLAQRPQVSISIHWCYSIAAQSASSLLKITDKDVPNHPRETLWQEEDVYQYL